MIRPWFRQAAVPWKTTATQTRASGENRVSTKPGVLHVAGCQRGLAQRADEPWVLAGGRAGQPLVAVGVGAVFALELVAGAGGDLLAVQVAGDGVVAQAGGGGDQRPGQGGAVPGALGQDRAAGAGLDAELVYPVVHDQPVAQGACGQLESPG